MISLFCAGGDGSNHRKINNSWTNISGHCCLCSLMKTSKFQLHFWCYKTSLLTQLPTLEIFQAALGEKSGRNVWKDFTRETVEFQEVFGSSGCPPGCRENHTKYKFWACKSRGLVTPVLIECLVMNHSTKQQTQCLTTEGVPWLAFNQGSCHTCMPA